MTIETTEEKQSEVISKPEDYLTIEEFIDNFALILSQIGITTLYILRCPNYKLNTKINRLLLDILTSIFYIYNTIYESSIDTDQLTEKTVTIRDTKIMNSVYCIIKSIEKLIKYSKLSIYENSIEEKELKEQLKAHMHCLGYNYQQILKYEV